MCLSKHVLRLWTRTYAPSFQFCVPFARGSSAVYLPHHLGAGTPARACAYAPSPPRWLAARARPDNARMSASAAAPAALADPPDGPATGQKFGQPTPDSAEGRASPGTSLTRNTVDNEHWLLYITCNTTPDPWAATLQKQLKTSNMDNLKYRNT